MINQPTFTEITNKHLVFVCPASIPHSAGTKAYRFFLGTTPSLISVHMLWKRVDDSSHSLAEDVATQVKLET